MENINDIRLRFLAIARMINGKGGHISTLSHLMKPIGRGLTHMDFEEGDPDLEED
jgi:hypothetical protein